MEAAAGAGGVIVPTITHYPPPGVWDGLAKAAVRKLLVDHGYSRNDAIRFVQQSMRDLVPASGCMVYALHGQPPDLTGLVALHAAMLNELMAEKA